MKLREDEVRVPAPGRRDPGDRDQPGRRGAVAGVAALHRHLPADRVDAADGAAAGLGRVRRLRAGDLPARRAGRCRAGVRRRRQAGRAGGRGRDAPRPSSTPTGSRCWTSWSGAPTSTRCSRRASASAATWRSGPRSTRGSRRRCASTRPACTTARWAPTPTPGRSPAAADIGGRLMIVFGSQDPHVPADARVQILSALYAAGLDDLELHVYARRRARVHARRRPAARPGADRSRDHRGGLVLNR